MSSNFLYAPTTVVGGGPVGLFGVFMAGMQGLRCNLVEVLPFLGGQCQALYPEKLIFDIPAFPSISGSDLVKALTAQIQPFQPGIYLNQNVCGLEHHKTLPPELLNQYPEESQNTQGYWAITTEKGDVFFSRAVLLCCGMGAFQPKKPPLPHLNHFENHSIRYAVQKIEDFRNKNVVIAGGGDSALDWAIQIAPVCSQLHLVHRRDHFRAQHHLHQQLYAWIEKGKIQLHTPFQLFGLEGEAGYLRHVIIQHLSNGESKKLDAHYLLPFFGMDATLGALASWPLKFDQGRIAIEMNTAQTNVPGIYAAGDVATYPHKYKLIATGFAEVSQGAYHIARHCFPERPRHFQHSTSTGISPLKS